MEKYKLFTDGGSRGNPGPAAAGVVCYSSTDEVVFAKGKYLGVTTNNEAEYKALVLGLEVCLEKKLTSVEVYMDSELVVKQVLGLYKVKNENLQTFHKKVLELKKQFTLLTFTHVRREKNKMADSLVNQTLDSGEPQIG